MTDEHGVTRSAAEPPLVLAIDVGSSSARVALFDAAARAVNGTFHRAQVRWSTAADGSVTTDAGALVERVCRLVDRLVDAAPDLAGATRLGGVSTLFHSFVGVDEDRRPVTPLLSWADTGADAEAARLRAALDPTATLERTGAPLHAGYWPARILRWRRDVPAAAWAGLPELLLHRLTGRWLVGGSIAGGTGMLDRRAGRWDATLLAALELDPERFPALHLGLEPVARLSGEAAARWPALRHVDWLAPVGDGACGNVGLGAVGADRAALMVGTSAAARAILGGHPSVPPGLFAYPLDGDRTLLGGALSEGGGTAAWWSRTTGRPLDALTGAAARASPGRAVVLPHLVGERGPGYRSDASLVLAGLRADHAAGDVLRAILEAVGISLAEMLARLGVALRSGPHIVAAGGALAASPLWAQIVCDAVGRPMELASVREPSLRGAAVVALHAAGLSPLRVRPPRGRLLRPHPARHAALSAAGERRRRLYDALYRRGSP